MARITVNGKDFKAIVSAATKFPILGGIAGSELVSLTAKNDILRASTLGTMLSQAKCVCVGTDVGFAIDIRLLTSFASVCSELNDVVIDVDQTITLKSKNKEITAPLIQAANHKMTPIKDLQYSCKLELTGALANQLNFLSALAFSDSSRAELCCVMLTKVNAIACSQKAVAVLSSIKADDNTALPLPIAKSLAAGDIVYVGPNETILRSGLGTYAIPSPVKAQAEFPVAAISSMLQTKETPLFDVQGSLFAAALAEADKCLSAIARTEITISIDLQPNDIVISGENGGAKYKANLPVSVLGTGKIHLPLVEISEASAFMDDTVLHVSSGANGETILKIGNAWFLFPAWTKK
jgi:hypothetical protein